MCEKIKISRFDLARHEKLAVRQRARCQRRIDHHFVVAIAQRLEYAMRQAEAPVLAVVRGAIGYPVRVLGQREQMRPKLGEASVARTGTL